MEEIDTRILPLVMAERHSQFNLWTGAAANVAQSAALPEAHAAADYIADYIEMATPQSNPGRYSRLALVPLLESDRSYVTGKTQDLLGTCSPLIIHEQAENAAYLSPMAISPVGRGVLLLRTVHEARLLSGKSGQSTDGEWNCRAERRVLEIDLLRALSKNNAFSAAVDCYRSAVEVHDIAAIPSRTTDVVCDREAKSYLAQMFGEIKFAETNVWLNVAYDAAVLERQGPNDSLATFAQYFKRNAIRQLARA